MSNRFDSLENAGDINTKLDELIRIVRCFVPFRRVVNANYLRYQVHRLKHVCHYYRRPMKLTMLISNFAVIVVIHLI